MGSRYFSRQNLTDLLIWELYIFPVPTLREADRISRASLESDLLSAKSLTNGPPTCLSFSTMDVLYWVFLVVQAVISKNLTKL